MRQFSCDCLRQICERSLISELDRSDNEIQSTNFSNKPA